MMWYWIILVAVVLLAFWAGRAAANWLFYRRHPDARRPDSPIFGGRKRR